MRRRYGKISSVTRSTRFGLTAVLSLTLLAVAGCSSTPTDGEPVVIARSTLEPSTTVPAAPRPARAADAAASTQSGSVPDPAAVEAAAEPARPGGGLGADDRDADDLNTEDLLFLSNITEFTLLEKPESDQIRVGLSMCNALYRGQGAPELVTEYLDEGSYTAAEIDNVLGAATSAYCPEFTGATR